MNPQRTGWVALAVSLLSVACSPEEPAQGATGGRDTGGSTATTGGEATATGGMTTAGAPSSGGQATGGSATGGTPTGGAATGGMATGGLSTGGTSTGGSATGGAATGGMAAGGLSAGGSLAGGAGGTGGTADPPSNADRKLTVGLSHACAIVGTELRCWGSNAHGQLGRAGGDGLTPYVVPGQWLSVSAGETFTCGVATDGGLWCWGQNIRGSLGRGSIATFDAPDAGYVGGGFVQVTTGRYNGCGLKSDGNVWCWGARLGMLGVYPLPATDQGSPIMVTYGSPYVSITSNASDVMAIQETAALGKRLYGWGSFNVSPKAIQNYGSTGGSPIDQGDLNDDGMYFRIGAKVQIATELSNNWTVADESSAPPNPIDVGAGRNNVCVIDASRVLSCKGYNRRGALGNGDWLPATVRLDWTSVRSPQGNWVRVDTNGETTCALDLQDTPWCWGLNANGELGDGTRVNRSLPSLVGQPPPAYSCNDGIASGTETKIDCGGDACPACPTCTDGAQNQDETDVDCGGTLCAACAIGKKCVTATDCGCTVSASVCEQVCPAGVCQPWCDDPDGDGYGEGPGCLGDDCDANDPSWYAECWIRDLFGPSTSWPQTIQRPATISMSDYRCVVVFATVACYAQNSPPCSSVSESLNITLDVTMQGDETLVVEAPYQDMCAPDYVGYVIDADGVPTGEPAPTTYPVPLFRRIWYYAPRDFDKCRVDLDGVDIPVEHRAETNIVGNDLVIRQECYTSLRDDTNGPTLLSDSRRYTTTIQLR